MLHLNCLTWNVHRCRGRDGTVNADRTQTALTGLLRTRDIDLLVLTEADGEQRPYRSLMDIERLEKDTGLLSAHHSPTLRWGAESDGFLGTIVLHSERVRLIDGALLDLPGHYPRGAVVLTCEGADRGFRVVATHLSLAQVLRVAQMRAIGQHLDRREGLPTLLIGDLNEWRPWRGLAFSGRVAGRAFAGPPRRSFPAAFPLLPLDGALTADGARVLEAAVIRQDDMRVASDHLPLFARIEIA
ncbi:MAG: endonuclease/exonuclease/phosphatase family protein [Pseudomonadota bacterium]